jgi:predicted permease
MDPAVLAFATALAVVTASGFGLLTAPRLSPSDLALRIRHGRGGVAGSRRRRVLRGALVVIQTSFALVLLVGSGLLARSVLNLRRVDPGYDTRDLLTFQVAPRPELYPSAEEAAAFHRAFMDRIAALPGVQSVGAVANLPLDESPPDANFVFEEVGPGQGGGPVRVGTTFASPGYFRTMGIALVEGRGFLGLDDDRDRGAAVVGRALAERTWPGRSALGERLRLGSDPDDPLLEVVGVVADVRERRLGAPPRDVIYLPFVPPSADADIPWVVTSPAYVVRAREPERLAPVIRAELRSLEPSSPMYSVRTMDWLAARSVGWVSFTWTALLVSAGMATLLGAVGLYGVLSYLVSLRTREIGIRLALGARARDVRRATVLEGARLTGLGLLVGLAGAAVLTRLLAGLLYGIEPLDPVTFVLVAATMLGVGILASWVPARRASSVDPLRSIAAD